MSAQVSPATDNPPRLLFVTGRLAEPSLRRVLDELAPRAGFVPEVAVMPISVAALMPPRWVARHLVVPPGIDRTFSSTTDARWISCGSSPSAQWTS